MPSVALNGPFNLEKKPPKKPCDVIRGNFALGLEDTNLITGSLCHKLRLDSLEDTGFYQGLIKKHS